MDPPRSLIQAANGMPLSLYCGRPRKRWKTISGGVLFLLLLNFLRGKKGLQYRVGGNLPRLPILFSKKFAKTSNKAWPNLCSHASA
jgi:hypothetical protein